MSADEQIDDLHKKYRIIEGDRKAYYEMSMHTMKSNKVLIQQLREENKELRRGLAAIQRETRSANRAGMTPLGWACLKGHLQLSQLLLKADADPLIKAHSGVLVGKTAITLARLHGSQGQTATWRRSCRL